MMDDAEKIQVLQEAAGRVIDAWETDDLDVAVNQLHHALWYTGVEADGSMTLNETLKQLTQLQDWLDNHDLQFASDEDIRQFSAAIERARTFIEASRGEES